MYHLLEFFLNVFTEFGKSVKEKSLSLKGLDPSTFCVRDQDATIVPARHMSETRSIN